MKIVAMYLPQFHSVPENDEWWGEGFTDWVSTKKANSIFEGHKQPHIPLNNNYYNLLNKEVMIWQSSLMKKYGVDGLCMYHYWFSDGKRMLEKPIENLLKWKDVNIPFCLCWANETWARSWGNVRNSNAWSKVEESGDKRGKSILLEQKYGGLEEWKKHINYLSDFFKDERYIRIENKPVLMIYKPSLIENLKKMIDFWNKRMRELGFDGVYIIGANCSPRDERIVDAAYYNEPGTSLLGVPKNVSSSGLIQAEYEDVWEYIISNKNVSGKKTYYGAFVGYDDTPRRGSDGFVVNNSSPELYERYLTQLIKKNALSGSDITFINAWNEWGEGMYLEPDEENGYAYLEATKRAIEKYELQPEKECNTTCWNDRLLEIKKLNCVHEINMNTLDLWMCVVESGGHVSKWFEDKGIRSIGIYGYGILAKHLISQLDESEIEVDYIIDQKKDACVEFDSYLPSDDFPYADAVVVCVPFYYGEVFEVLKSKNISLIISIKEIIEDLS